MGWPCAWRSSISWLHRTRTDKMGWNKQIDGGIGQLRTTDPIQAHDLDALPAQYEEGVDFIIDLTEQDPSADVLKRVLDVQGEWRSKGFSVVLLIEEEQQKKIDSSLEIAMAPTQQEALDLIEMERIERLLNL